MPDSESNLAALRARLERLGKRPSGLLALGSALIGQAEASDEQVCALHQDDLPNYIEAELNGESAQRRYPELARHLDLCAGCVEVYLDLLELALETEQAPLPISSEAPALDLSFLSATTVAEQIWQLVEEMTREILRHLEPQALPDLPAASKLSFHRLAESGVDYKPERLPALALGFGSELPPALQSVVVAHVTTLDLLRDLPAGELEKELSSALPSATLHKRARSVARAMGMNRSTANQWAGLYVTEARTHARDLVELAHLVAQDERPD